MISSCYPPDTSRRCGSGSASPCARPTLHAHVRPSDLKIGFLPRLLAFLLCIHLEIFFQQQILPHVAVMICTGYTTLNKLKQIHANWSEEVLNQIWDTAILSTTGLFIDLVKHKALINYNDPKKEAFLLFLLFFFFANQLHILHDNKIKS